MTATFDDSLVTGEFFPVRLVDAADTVPVKYGLRRLLVEAGSIASLAVTPPPAQAALLRILYVVTARVSGLDRPAASPSAWLDRRDDVAEEGLDPERVDAYLAEHAERLRLFGARPFLQDPRLAEECSKKAGVNKLVFGRPAGSNQVWFGHHRDADPRPVPADEALLHLLMWLYYGAAGRCSTRTVGSVSAADSRSGPLRGSLSYHPEGPTLLHTLVAGIPRPGNGTDPATDRCPWELPELPDPLHPSTANVGPMSQLTAGWQHALLLQEGARPGTVDDAYITWAARDKLPRPEDPFLVLQLSQAGNIYARRAKSARALWRDIDALLIQEPYGTAKPRRPAAFHGVLELDPEGGGPLRVRALGFEQDDRTKDIQYISGTTPPVLDLIEEREPRLSARLRTMRVAGELYGRRLDFAVRQAWRELVNDSDAVGPWGELAAVDYWPAAEREFWRRVGARDMDQPWQSFRLLAYRAFDKVTASAPPTMRAARAVQRARLAVAGGRRKKK
ncbi:type I-E CRISPR-associated protein Cse1/CasA [Streptomyces sp. SPB074]|uniref:type I-E CRISPR-associated protein Cse1/CasA n=1 Tax=Streptomyces sp. (strain SPB074) TaxID=465543 RepID=UPI00017F0E3E|nr:type I-E CRISPR-associated protein Cse1/CasA [Streptomyces sp. SPB074]EDY43243.2 cse1 family CRISPR-associated protein [Streptomyces sp. SPB074]